MSTEPLSKRTARVIDGISYLPSSVILAGIPRISFKDDHSFAVLDNLGEARRSWSDSGELGVYFNDTRHICIWETLINGESPIALAHQLRSGGNTIVISMTNPDLKDLETGERIPRDTLLIRKILSLKEDTLFENVVIQNFGNRTYALDFEHWAGSRFDDIFEVRGFKRLSRGVPQNPSQTIKNHFSETCLSYLGIDGVLRSTQINCLFPCTSIDLTRDHSGVRTRLSAPPREDIQLRTVASFDKPWDGKLSGQDLINSDTRAFVESVSIPRKSADFSCARIETDHPALNRSIENALIDLRMLLTSEKDGNSYPYAGIPWYSAPFGRDGLLTAYQLLPWAPEIAKGVLNYVWRRQGTSHDSFTDEAPGKIFHEMRRGEMAAMREVPFIPYFGSVDSTPLAIILLHEYYLWTADRDTLQQSWPFALRALEWIQTWGDPDGDGFLEYSRESPTGLINQGWKDSHDSIMHSDGRLADAPIRLCEVQAYAYRARICLSELARVIGNQELSQRLRLDALRLKAKFKERFWNPNGGYLHLAIDRSGAPCNVRSSNMGHALWGQILDGEQAESVTQHLMSPALFSGYGIRTLADTEAAYNPLSYHNGSVWPHDNSLIIEGFRVYRQREALETLAEAMIGVLESSPDYRLPELFCGFRKRSSEPPVPYQVACKPQAWAAGSIFLLIKALSGIALDPNGMHLLARSPWLTSKINWIEIRGLRVRDSEVDLRVLRTQSGARVVLLRSKGPIRFLQLK